MRKIGLEERRARLGVRHHLANSVKASEPHEVGCSMVALHGTDPASVFLSIAARMRDPTIAAIERAMYDDRTLIRMLGMRRTVFTVPVELAGVVQAACTRGIAAKQRKLYTDLWREAAFTDDVEGWLADVESSTLRALAKRREATATELSKDEPRLSQQMLVAQGKPYEAMLSVSTRLLFLLAAEGHIMRGRPRGSWISSQYRWSPTEVWLPGGLPDLPTNAAQIELVRHWLRAFGPGTVADLRWWTGLTAGEIKRALESLQVAEVDFDGVPGVLLPDDVEPVATPEPWIALLPALDPTSMGWQARGWYLGEYAPILFDRSGNVGPTIWSDGRIVGGWAQQKSGQVAFRLLEDIGSDKQRQVAAAAADLRAFLGAVRVTPRFRTPLERELSA